MIETHIKALVELFRPLCSDTETLDALWSMASDYRSWGKAHALFGRIRQKTIEADKTREPVLAAQYFFEESCSKTMYNLSGFPAPFDADAPYWVIPSALALAKRLGLDSQHVVETIDAEPRLRADAPKAARR